MSPSDAHSPRRLPLPRLRPPTRAQARLATRRLWESAKGALVPPRDDIEARNSYFLRREQVSTAIVGAATSFGSNFAVRLGASNLLVSLLSSGPSLLVVLMTLPTARFLEKRRDRIWWIVNSRFIQRLVFLAIALMPFFARTHQAELFVGLQLFRQLLLAPQSAGWSALIADLVPERKRTSVVAGRHILHAAVTIVATPIVDRGEIVGVLCADRIVDRPFTDREQALLEEATRQVLRALENERVFVQLERSKREQTVLYKASQALGAALDRDAVMKAGLEAAREIVRYDVAAITSFDPEQKKHRVERVEGESIASLEGLEFKDNHSLAAMAVKISRDMPLPTPRSVICSPSHMIRPVPAVMVSTISTMTFSRLSVMLKPSSAMARSMMSSR